MQKHLPGNALVSLDLIDWEDTGFAIHSFAPCDLLEASFSRCGVLFPPLICEREGERYAIVDGFKRLRWAKEKGKSELQCLIYPKDANPMDLLLLRIEGKITGSPLNPAEKAQIVSKLVGCIPAKKLIGSYLPALGISSRTDMVRKWRLLAASDEILLSAVASEIISEKAALELVSWEGETEAAAEAISLLRDLRCSASIQKEILDRVTEIARGRGCERLELFRDPAFRAVASAPEMNHREKTQTMRDFLGRLRFPRLKEREDRFLRDVEAAALPGGVRLVPPASFEGVGWQLQIVFSRPEELTTRLGEAKTFAVSESLRKILER
ncbi:MAG: ParB N-terminal domain-containing protein [Syntrophobacteraceae bacterium]